MVPTMVCRGNSRHSSRKGFYECVGVRYIAIALFLWPVTLAAQQALHFRVRDSIEMATFTVGGSQENQRVTFSPDGRYFVTVTKRGLLKSNQLESTLWLFNSEAVKHFLANQSNVENCAPQALATMASSSNDEPITHVRWASDGKGIAFLGRNGVSLRQLFAVDINSRQLSELTPKGQDVTDYDVSSGIIAYATQAVVNDTELYESAGPKLSDVQIGTGLSLESLLYPDWVKLTYGLQPNQLWMVSRSGGSPVTDNKRAAPVFLIGSKIFSLSPSGRYLLVTKFVEQVPKTWESYQPAFPSATNRIVADASNEDHSITAGRPQQYAIIDLENGTVEVLVDAPLGLSAGYYEDPIAAWSNDEHEIALSNTFLPLNGVIDTREAHLTHPCVAAVEIATHRVECVKSSPPLNFKAVIAGKDLKLSEIEWSAGNQRMALRYKGRDGSNDAPPELFRRENEAWTPTRTPAVTKEGTARMISNGGISVAIQQSLNNPPVLMATDIRKGTPRQIWDPNPQLRRIDLGQAEVFHWHDKAGHKWTGGLVRPHDYVSGHQYPLVIQTHGFHPEEFLVDGAYPTANAARALAARGIVVLQVQENTEDAFTPQGAEVDGVADYVSAIDQLSRDGVVDPTRVGIIGFSYTGQYVLESLIQAPQYFVAATLAEGTSVTFGEYLLEADYPGGPQFAQALRERIGAEPFGEGLNQWVKRSPGFNTDKIRVPILFEAHSPPVLIYCWDIYAALRLQGKPVELLYMRNGTHILTKPLERLASQETNVDWYDFWLNGHEDPDPDKAEQYARWRELRKEQPLVADSHDVRPREQ